MRYARELPVLPLPASIKTPAFSKSSALESRCLSPCLLLPSCSLECSIFSFLPSSYISEYKSFISRRLAVAAVLNGPNGIYGAEGTNPNIVPMP
jgi:hypothetical protein